MTSGRLLQSQAQPYLPPFPIIKYIFPPPVAEEAPVHNANARWLKEEGLSCQRKRISLPARNSMENWRLGCQVKLREDMKIRVPEEVLGIKKWECEVVSNRNVATFIKEFVVRLPEGENMEFKSGGYIQIDVPKTEVDFKDIEVEEEFRDEWDQFNMWDLKMKNPEPTYRAYSMANHPAEGNIIMLNIRIATPPWDRSKGTFKSVNPGICSSFVFPGSPVIK
jgi:Na+-transporting NADH:ubiquinone oxidoreductase subunit F